MASHSEVRSGVRGPSAYIRVALWVRHLFGAVAACCVDVAARYGSEAMPRLARGGSVPLAAIREFGLLLPWRREGPINDERILAAPCRREEWR